MPIRLSGMSSGLDTDAIVKELVSAYSTKKESVVKKQTKLEWTQDAWKSMNTKIYNFYSSKLSNMRFSASYSKKSSSVSNSSVAKVTANSSAVNGTQTLKVKQLATSGYLTGSEIKAADGSAVKLSSKLSDVLGTQDGQKLGSVEVKVGDTTKQIELSNDMTVSQFVNKLKDSGVNASFDEKNQRFFISAKTSGEKGDFAITASDSSSVSALKGLGIYAATDAEMAKYKKDAAIDVEAEVAKAYSKQQTAHTDADKEKAALQKQLDSLKGDQSTFAKKQEYLTAKAAYLQMDYDVTEEDELDEQGNPKLDAEGNPIKREVVNFAADASRTDKIASIEADIENFNTQLDVLKEKGTLTDEEKEQKASLENQLKAAKDAVGILGNETYTAADYKRYMDSASSELTNATTEVDKINSQIADIEDKLSSEDKLNAHVDAKNADIDAKNAELESNLRDYYTNLKATADTILAENASGSQSMATRIVGRDSEIELNGATFKNNTNTFDINGLTIQATATTGDEAVTITTDTDVDGIYNMIKDFFKSYNELMKEMDQAYNAESASKYEPLTDEEKDAMTDTQIEKWEQKIKDALLRKDSTLGNLSSIMKTAMSSSQTVNGKTLSLATFGIKTAGYFSSEISDRGIYHIDGDSDDNLTSGSTDKLRAAIAADPDQVIEFFSKLSSQVYSKLTDKMASTSLSSAYTVYNDKQMKSQYSSYKTEVSDWEKKITAYEDRYYKQFSQMEQALAKLNSQTSSLSGLFGQ